MPRQRIDPKRQALEARAAQLQAECARHYRKMRLAFGRLEKARRALVHVGKRIKAMDTATTTTTPHQPAGTP